MKASRELVSALGNRQRSCILALLTIFLYCGDLPAQGLYKVSRTIHVSGNDGWDYVTVDEHSDRLWVAHGTMVQVVDCKTGQLAATISNTRGVHGVALVEEEHKAYITCGADSSVMVVDMLTLKAVKSINIRGANPDAIVYDEFSHRVFCFNGRSASASVIDVGSDTLIQTIALEGKPEAAVVDGRGQLFVNIEDKSSLSVIDTKILLVEKTWSLAPGEGPSGLAIDPFHHRLFSVCSNKTMIVLDSRNGRICAKLEIGDHVDGAAFDPVLGHVFSSNGDGGLTVVDASDGEHFTVLETLPTKRSARTIAINTKTHHIYLPYAEFLPPPAPTAEKPRPRAQIKPDSFNILDIVATK